MVLQNEKNIEKRISKVELTCTALRDENKEIRQELASLKHKQQEEHKEKEERLKGKNRKAAKVPTAHKNPSADTNSQRTFHTREKSTIFQWKIALIITFGRFLVLASTF